MNDKRVTRSRPSAESSRPAGRASSALARRTGRAPAKADKVDVVAYEGSDDTTPLVEMIKSTRPHTDKFREGEYIHVSDVISKCMRKIALMRRMNMSHPTKSLMEGQAITFAIGESIHDYVKARFIAGHPAAVWAKWTCPCGTSAYTGVYANRPKRTCPSCNMVVSKHNEVSFVHPDYALKGTPDMLLWLEEYAAFYVTELKSIAAAAFAELVRPIPDHVIQVALYWHILKRLGHPVVDRVSILYVNKEFSFKFPYKEYVIDPQEVDLSPYWEDLEAFAAAIDGGDLPPRVMCGTPTAPAAKECPVCVTCFGSD